LLKEKKKVRRTSANLGRGETWRGIVELAHWKDVASGEGGSGGPVDSFWEQTKKKRKVKEGGAATSASQERLKKAGKAACSHPNSVLNRSQGKRGGGMGRK